MNNLIILTDKHVNQFQVPLELENITTLEATKQHLIDVIKQINGRLDGSIIEVKVTATSKILSEHYTKMAKEILNLEI